MLGEDVIDLPASVLPYVLNAPSTSEASETTEPATAEMGPDIQPLPSAPIELRSLPAAALSSSNVLPYSRTSAEAVAKPSSSPLASPDEAHKEEEEAHTSSAAAVGGALTLAELYTADVMSASSASETMAARWQQAQQQLVPSDPSDGESDDETLQEGATSSRRGVGSFLLQVR